VKEVDLTNALLYLSPHQPYQLCQEARQMGSERKQIQHHTANIFIFTCCRHQRAGKMLWEEKREKKEKGEKRKKRKTETREKRKKEKEQGARCKDEGAGRREEVERNREERAMMRREQRVKSRRQRMPAIPPVIVSSIVVCVHLLARITSPHCPCLRVRILEHLMCPCLPCQHRRLPVSCAHCSLRHLRR
jgi:cobalamin biosynthesis Mg chelatase CobN